jgi:hypothetical protein
VYSTPVAAAGGHSGDLGREGMAAQIGRAFTPCHPQSPPVSRRPAHGQHREMPNSPREILDCRAAATADPMGGSEKAEPHVRAACVSLESVPPPWRRAARHCDFSLPVGDRRACEPLGGAEEIWCILTLTAPVGRHEWAYSGTRVLVASTCADASNISVPSAANLQPFTIVLPRCFFPSCDIPS